ncbi:MAG: beta-lactamase family protein [Acidobacteriota bacterium]|nr:beta-lactamase family protein [Acidobacteriota bacterium]
MRCAQRFIVVVCATLILAPADLRAQSAPEDPLIGIWASETTFRPNVLGELTVVRDGSGWRATVSGVDAKLKVTGKNVSFVFPGKLGQFRGTLISKGRAINGFWLQPSGVNEERPNPTGARQAFATPLVLQRAGRNIWHGTVRPLEERFTLYLKIYRNAQGLLVGAFRNHDFNSNGGASLFRVTLEGDKVLLTARPDETLPEIRHNATLIHSPERLQLFWGDVGRVLDLARRTPEQAPNFFPRPLTEAKYVYGKPAQTDDGWATARAGEVGIDEAALTRLVQKLIDADPAARRPSLIHSLLVAYRGKLVLEEYFFGFNRERVHDTRSAGKTFASVMLGATMMRGTKIAPETEVYDLLALRGPFANPDPRKSQITLGHLMTHTSGLDCNDNNDNSLGNEDTMQTQKKQPDWWKYTLDLPMAHDPGTRYAYCSANMNLMGAALTTASHTWLPELFERTIARPLQFGPYYWNLMPTDEGYLGGGAWLRPRDLLKVGQAYLDGGVWQGRRIVDASWVTQSTAPRMHVSPATTGLTPEEFGDFYGEGDDAYAWHLGGVRDGKRDYMATGNGGQILLVIPQFDLVVVLTGANYRQGGIWGRWGDEIVNKQIIPAIRR